MPQNEHKQFLKSTNLSNGSNGIKATKYFIFVSKKLSISLIFGPTGIAQSLRNKYFHFSFSKLLLSTDTIVPNSNSSSKSSNSQKSDILFVFNEYDFRYPTRTRRFL